MHRFVRRGVVVLFGLFVAAQLVPYGWSKPNPPVVTDAPWPDAESARLARGACYSCHSNETDWPLYSYVAPMSWLVRADVESGRDALNFSEWDGDTDDSDDRIEDGSMPPNRFTLLHPEARLSAAEKARLLAALETMEDERRDRAENDRRGRNRGSG